MFPLDRLVWDHEVAGSDPVVPIPRWTYHPSGRPIHRPKTKRSFQRGVVGPVRGERCCGVKYVATLPILFLSVRISAGRHGPPSAILRYAGVPGQLHFGTNTKRDIHRSDVSSPPAKVSGRCRSHLLAWPRYVTLGGAPTLRPRLADNEPLPTLANNEWKGRHFTAADFTGGMSPARRHVSTKARPVHCPWLPSANRTLCEAPSCSAHSPSSSPKTSR